MRPAKIPLRLAGQSHAAIVWKCALDSVTFESNVTLRVERDLGAAYPLVFQSIKTNFKKNERGIHATCLQPPIAAALVMSPVPT